MVVSNEPQGVGAWMMRIAVPRTAFPPRPGQFVTLRVGESTDPLLRRPFSVCNAALRQSGDGALFEILYKAVGRGTRLMTRIKPGERVSILGPLGHGFTLPNRKAVCILVAGGMGIAPLVLLARWLLKVPVIDDRRRVVFLIGAKTKDAIYYADELSDYGITLKVATEDGSAGLRGTVLDLLGRVVRALRPSQRKKRRGKKTREKSKPSPVGGAAFAGEPVYVYACGPAKMLRKVGRLAEKNKFPCEVSLEQRMACGVGACRGCVVPVAGRKKGRTDYATVCQDGPVFRWGKVAL
jgi:dihydroorotate dehydrogenase electron transfer subunit